MEWGKEDKAVRGYPVFSSAFLCSPGLVGRVIGGVDQKKNKHLQIKQPNDEI